MAPLLQCLGCDIVPTQAIQRDSAGGPLELCGKPIPSEGRMLSPEYPIIQHGNASHGDRFLSAGSGVPLKAKHARIDRQKEGCM